jgi:uncharacterized membrane protein YecN with MAPEG domain
MSMILPISLTIAGAAALLNIWLTSRVVRVRAPLKISVGDGGNEAVLRRMRAHSNYAENMPIFVILLALVELAGGNKWLLWGAGILFILARISHAFGMDKPSLRIWRMIGMSTSTVLVILLAGYAVLVAYQAPAIHEGIQISPGRTALRS